MRSSLDRSKPSPVASPTRSAPSGASRCERRASPRQASSGDTSTVARRGEVASSLRVCSRCVMDTTDPDIRFDGDGVCNHCHEYERKASVRLFPAGEGERRLERLVEQMRREGRGRDYDCILGVSGGVDSTFLAYKARELGLRPLAVHFDNGWNSELAVSNIEKVLDRLGIDLYTHVVDWEEFRDLQLSFLEASVPDAEIPTDHAIQALLFRVALQRKVRFILSGMNFRTESTCTPTWAYGHSDWRYIRAIHRRFGSLRPRTVPHYSLPYLAYAMLVRRVRLVALLNYLSDYDKSDTVDLLERELGWRRYGGKHHESLYTKFLQSYILPRKFGIDKRKLHLTSLIHSGQITREAALRELQRPAEPEEELERDRQFVIKKLGLDESRFEALLERPPRTFHDYPNTARVYACLRRLQEWLRRVGIFPS